MTDDRLPTALLVEGHLRYLDKEGIPYYIVNKGGHAAGTILLKLNGLETGCTVLIQQRDLDGNLGWMETLGAGAVEEKEADDYIRRAVGRDPDLWVIEIEDREKRNPFEGKLVVS